MTGGDPIAELIARIRQAGLDPDARQLADALWLARWSRPTDRTGNEWGSTSASGHKAAAEDPAAGRRDTRREERPPPGGRPGTARRDTETDRRVALYPVPRDGAPRGYGQGRSAVLPVGVPAAPVFPSPLEL